VAKDKYVDLAGHEGIRVRIERLDGRPPSGRFTDPSPKIWWDRELIAFLTPASPRVSEIVEAERKIHSALKDLALRLIVDWKAAETRGEVVMFHGTFVKVEVWCPAGTAKLLGIKGYDK
jgi:hypothetical protein